MLMQPRMEIALKFIRYHKNTSWANAHSKFLTYVWESPCWYTNIILCLSNCVIFGILLQIELKNGKKLCVTVTDCLQKKWQKILFESGSLLSPILYLNDLQVQKNNNKNTKVCLLGRRIYRREWKWKVWVKTFAQHCGSEWFEATAYYSSSHLGCETLLFTCTTE